MTSVDAMLLQTGYAPRMNCRRSTQMKPLPGLLGLRILTGTERRFKL